ncbi:hypothetical protein Maes01_01226 [Microbulbifer aestuariivivens]|uniref:Uncharacterized protein n=1 Tax=Microbulbifer aestuariivivens TaxID=1908308 RepID=A0ABP9WNH7_9GAMM
MKKKNLIVTSLVLGLSAVANAGEVIDGEWPIVVVGPKAAKVLPSSEYKNIGVMNGKEIFVNISGKANDPVTGSDGSDPEPNGGVDRVAGTLTIVPVAKANDPVTGSDGSDPEPNGGVDRVLGTINLSTIPDEDPFGTSKTSGILLLDYVGKANDPVTGSDGSDPEPNGGVDRLSGAIYSSTKISEKLGQITLDMKTIKALQKD